MDQELHEFLVPLDGKRLCEEFGEVRNARDPGNTELVMLDTISNSRWKGVSMLVQRLTLTEAVARPTAHALSVKRAVSGYPKAARMVLVPPTTPRESM